MAAICEMAQAYFTERLFADRLCPDFVRDSSVLLNSLGFIKPINLPSDGETDVQIIAISPNRRNAGSVYGVSGRVAGKRCHRRFFGRMGLQPRKPRQVMQAV